MNNSILEVSFILIPYNNRSQFLKRLERDITPTIKAHPGWKFQVIIVDNSDTPDPACFDMLPEVNICPVYLWPGRNIMYGPSINLALCSDPYPYIVYLCTSHGRMYDPSWIDDLIQPMLYNPKVAMTGSHYRSCRPEVMGFSPDLPAVHIQGGIFAARTEAMKKYPYTDDNRWVHWGSDVYQSFQLLNAGFQLHDVTTIKSVWRQQVTSPQRWKYVHDNSEE